MRALFFVAEGPGYGNGHAVRSGALRDELTARGWTCDWRIPHGNPDLVISDVPDDGRVSGVHAKAGVLRVEISDDPSRRVSQVDDDGDVRPHLVVNGCAGATPEMYAGSAKSVLAGPEYALLRPVFADFRNIYGSRDFGGVRDIRNVSGATAEQLAWWLIGADAVITYGGMRCLEAACVGAPMVIDQEDEAQELNAVGLRDKGAAWLLPKAPEGPFRERLLQETARKLAEDSKARITLSRNGRALIDGLGVKRVADAIEELFR